MRAIRTADFFCGIGGIRLGFERACDVAGLSHSCVYSCDINPDSCRIYEARFGSPNPMGDITQLDASSLPDFDVALAGFPCQTFSIAGNKAGFEDTRGTLFFHLAKALEAKRPKAFVFENVKNLVHHDGGRTLGRMLEVLRDLGYCVFTDQLNSKDFGVPQNRPRVYIVGFSGLGGGFDWPAPTDQTKRLKHILETGADPKFFLSKQYWTSLKAHRARHEAKGGGFGYVIRKPDGISGTVLCGGMGKERNLVVDRSVPVLGTDTNEDGVRTMTPMEWERLQGYPENWTEGCSNTSRMEMLGNSVTVNVIEAISRQVIKEIVSPTRMLVSIFD